MQVTLKHPKSLKKLVLDDMGNATLCDGLGNTQIKKYASYEEALNQAKQFGYIVKQIIIE